jgi:hypothetical protein
MGRIRIKEKDHDIQEGDEATEATEESEEAVGSQAIVFGSAKG